jgi:DNA-binding CsgD family transcriptional regulator
MKLTRASDEVHTPFGIYCARSSRGVCWAAMDGLQSCDLRAALEFIAAAWSLAGERAFTLETLAALNELIPSDLLEYYELDRVDHRVVNCVGSDDGEGDMDLFWRIVDEHPLCRHQQAYLDFSAKRLSDVISRPRLVDSRVYAEWFRPYGVEAELEIGIARSRAWTRNFILDRARGDFSERDRAVFELVRPHLRHIYEMTELRRAVGSPGPEDLTGLTAREAEILELVAAGLSNAAIAERLWISPGTVKKHLENMYAKLGVANRTAAVTRMTPEQRHGGHAHRKSTRTAKTS